MFKRILYVVITASCLLSTQCDEDIIAEHNTECANSAVVDATWYERVTTENYAIDTVEIFGNCLDVTITASGCDSNLWEFTLVDSGAVAESSPEQRYLKLSLKNQGVCSAFFEKRMSFDISTLQLSASGTIILNLKGFSDTINYTY